MIIDPAVKNCYDGIIKCLATDRREEVTLVIIMLNNNEVYFFLNINCYQKHNP